MVCERRYRFRHSRKLSQSPQLLAQGRVTCFGPQPLILLHLVGNLIVDFDLVVVVIRQSSVNLPEGQVGVLKVHFLRAPTVGELIEHYLDHFRVGASDPCSAAGIYLNVCCGPGRRQRTVSFSSYSYEQFSMSAARNKPKPAGLLVQPRFCRAPAVNFALTLEVPELVISMGDYVS